MKTNPSTVMVVPFGNASEIDQKPIFGREEKLKNILKIESYQVYRAYFYFLYKTSKFIGSAHWSESYSYLCTKYDILKVYQDTLGSTPALDAVVWHFGMTSGHFGMALWRICDDFLTTLWRLCSDFDKNLGLKRDLISHILTLTSCSSVGYTTDLICLCLVNLKENWKIVKWEN